MFRDTEHGVGQSSSRAIGCMPVLHFTDCPPSQSAGEDGTFWTFAATKQRRNSMYAQQKLLPAAPRHGSKSRTSRCCRGVPCAPTSTCQVWPRARPADVVPMWPVAVRLAGAPMDMMIGD